MTSVPYLHQAACISLFKSGNSKQKKQWTSPHNDHQTQILFYHIPAMSRFDGGRADLTCISFAYVCNKVKCVFRVGRIPYCCLMPVHSWIHVCLKSGASWAGTCVVKACQSKQTTTLTMLLSSQALPSPEPHWGPWGSSFWGLLPILTVFLWPALLLCLDWFPCYFAFCVSFWFSE